MQHTTSLPSASRKLRGLRTWAVVRSAQQRFSSAAAAGDTRATTGRALGAAAPAPAPPPSAGAGAVGGVCCASAAATAACADSCRSNDRFASSACDKACCEDGRCGATALSSSVKQNQQHPAANSAASSHSHVLVLLLS